MSNVSVGVIIRKSMDPFQPIQGRVIAMSGTMEFTNPKLCGSESRTSWGFWSS